MTYLGRELVNTDMVTAELQATSFDSSLTDFSKIFSKPAKVFRTIQPKFILQFRQLSIYLLRLTTVSSTPIFIRPFKSNSPGLSSDKWAALVQTEHWSSENKRNCRRCVHRYRNVSGCCCDNKTFSKGGEETFAYIFS